MALSRSIEELLARAAETSTIDEAALDDLGRLVLEALILEPETPDPLKQTIARVLGSNADTRLPAVGLPEETPQ